MRKATLITGLETQMVMMHHVDEGARYHVMPPMRPLIASDGAMSEPFEEMTVTEQVVPITHLCQPGKPDLYIAYSEEVEELIGMPFRTILREKNQAQAALQTALNTVHELRSMTAWQHIKEAWQKLVPALWVRT
jgi:hypothetical protein